MDDLEFRRRILANPHDKSHDILEALKGNSSNQQLVGELHHLDSLIEQTLDVEVPDDLADTILFRQAAETHVQEKSPRNYLAIAASVAFVCGLMIGQLNWRNVIIPTAQASLGDTALAHVVDEAGMTDIADEQVSLQQVNSKLAPFGQQFVHELPAHIYYVNHCSFTGIGAALHLVMQGEHDRITVFVVPTNSVKDYLFDDDHLKGEVVALSSAQGHASSLIVVGDKAENLTAITKQLESNLTFKI
ncbi:MAG: DUF3379 domain-containing protein [Aliivibrio sp.]|uniref:DUF3379 family protein n=1 Tax=Aliivibrio sp. TaxID=1872443 RepID=UPI001A4F3189|nr:DUF3379 domain-containing protein [Aliivibrio sp.]